MRKKKYQFTVAMQKPVLLALLLLVSCLLHAQRQEEAPVDSVTVLAPAPDDSTELVTEIQQQAEEEAEQKDGSTKKAQYFEPRQMPGTIDSIFFRRSDDSSIAGLKNEDDFWYANTVFAKKKKQEERDGDDSSFSNSGFFQILLWLCIIGGFIAFLIIYLSNSNVGLFRSSKRIKDTVIDAETDDIFAIQYQQEIDKAVKAGNYRLGVRLLFLQLLRNLADKHIIEYTKDRTNFDYLLQVQHASWYSLFFRLTRNYEYVWYGQFDIDREKFELVKNEFTHLAQQLPRV